MILTNDERLWKIAWSICNVGRDPDGEWYQHDRLGQNYRMTELQAAILLAQMTRLDEQMRQRDEAANLLNQLMDDIEGIRLLQYDPKMTRHAHHLYMFKLDSSIVNKVKKADFIKKLNAEGIPAHEGYVPLNQNKAILSSIEEWTGSKRLDSCPICERLCKEEVVWLPQNVLLSGEQAMHDIAKAVQKVLRSYMV